MSVLQMSSSNLGQPISEHRLSFSQKWGVLAGAIILIGLGPGIYFGLTMFWASLGTSLDEVFRSVPFLRYLPLIVGSVCFLTGLLRLLQVGRNWPLEVILYERGMDYTDKNGLRTIDWESIEGVWQRVIRYYLYGFIPYGTTYWYMVKARDGEIIVFDNRFSQIKKLGETLLERLADVQLPKYLANVQAGKRVDFGALSLDGNGIHYGGKQLKWGDVDNLVLEQGILSIYEKSKKWGSWAHVYIYEIPNVNALYLLAEKLGKVGSG